MGVVALIASASLGTVYVDAVTHHFSVAWSFPSWILFIASIFTNLYFLYCLTNLRGVGDIAGENKAKTFGRLAQLLITALLLMAGFGLMAASIGFLAYSTIMRFVANRMSSRSHKDVQRGLSSDHISHTQSRNERSAGHGLFRGMARRSGFPCLVRCHTGDVITLLSIPRTCRNSHLLSHAAICDGSA